MNAADESSRPQVEIGGVCVASGRSSFDPHSGQRSASRPWRLYPHRRQYRRGYGEPSSGGIVIGTRQAKIAISKRSSKKR